MFLLQWTLSRVAQRSRVAGRAGWIGADHARCVGTECTLSAGAHGDGVRRDDVAIRKASATTWKGRRWNGLSAWDYGEVVAALDSICQHGIDELGVIAAHGSACRGADLRVGRWESTVGGLEASAQRPQQFSYY